MPRKDKRKFAAASDSDPPPPFAVCDSRQGPDAGAGTNGHIQIQTNSGHRLEFGHLGRSIIKSLPVGVIAFDCDLKIIETNTRAAELVEPAENIDESLAKGTDENIWQSWTGQLRTAISTGGTLRFDNVSYTRGSRTRILRILCTPLKQSDADESIGGVIVIEDITERVDIERQLANAERLAAVGKLASKVAHELNNPLDGILRYINLAIRRAEQSNLAKPLDYLQQCRKGLLRMVQITSELLEFSRRTYCAFEYTQIEQIIEESIRAMESRISSANVKIERNYAAGLPKIRSGELFQVFCNLIKNATDVMPDGGKLTISTRRRPDNTAVIEFRDTGSGLPPENPEAIFEPFFTTKGRGKGTGLGLAICKDIVEKYKGRITAENAPDKGSIFRVCIPMEGNLDS